MPITIRSPTGAISSIKGLHEIVMFFFFFLEFDSETKQHELLSDTTNGEYFTHGFSASQLNQLSPLPGR